MVRSFSMPGTLTAGLLLAAMTAADLPARPAQGHSCEVFLPTAQGFRLVTVNGTEVSPRGRAFGGDLSYGVVGEKLAVIGVVPATPMHPPRLMFTLWDTRTQKVLLRKYSSPVRFIPPHPMMGFLNGLAVAGHAAYFQSWELRGNPPQLRIVNLLAKVDFRTGAVARAVSIPAPAKSAPLYQALAVPNGLVLTCGCGGARSVWWYTPGTGRLSAQFSALVPQGYALMYIYHYGLVGWNQDGRLQRFTRSNMAKAKYPALAIPRGVVDAQCIYRHGEPLLACLVRRGTYSKPLGNRLFVYDLRKHKMLWSKTFGSSIGGLIYPSFRPSPNGDVFAFIVAGRPPKVMFYDRRSGRVTKIELPPRYYGLAGARVVAAK